MGEEQEGSETLGGFLGSDRLSGLGFISLDEVSSQSRKGISLMGSEN